MKCPSCSVENPDGKEFCSDCGAPLPEPVAPATVAASVPTPTPATPAAAAPAPTPAPQYQPPAAAQPAATPAFLAKFKLTGPIALIIAGVILLGLIGCGTGAYLLLNGNGKPGTTEKNGEIVVTGPGPDIVIPKEKGWGTAMDALADVAEQYYKGAAWESLIVTEEADRMEYYLGQDLGQDTTTYDKGVIIELKPIGWQTTRVYTLNVKPPPDTPPPVTPPVNPPVDNPPPDPPPDPPDDTPEYQTTMKVIDFLLALSEQRYDDALKMTTKPLSDADLTTIPTNWTDINLDGINAQEDGSYLVLFTITWEGGTDEACGAQVVPAAEGGWLISQLGAYSAQ